MGRKVVAFCMIIGGVLAAIPVSAGLSLGNQLSLNLLILCSLLWLIIHIVIGSLGLIEHRLFVYCASVLLFFQIPILSSGSFCYWVYTGGFIPIVWGEESKLSIKLGGGVIIQLYDADYDAFVGVNLFSLFMLVLVFLSAKLDELFKE